LVQTFLLICEYFALESLTDSGLYLNLQRNHG